MVEQAKYEVLREINKVEIRRYPSLVTARVDGYGDGGFNLLFNFITGSNGQKSKIKNPCQLGMRAFYNQIS
jgi:hypothetical protein